MTKLERNLAWVEKQKQKRILRVAEGRVVPGVWLRRLLHPLLIWIIRLKRRIENRKLVVMGQPLPSTHQPIIFAATHIGKYDIEALGETINRHIHILFADSEWTHGTLDGLLLQANGVLDFISADKLDSSNVKEDMVKLLKLRENILWFPEGKWNLSPNLITLPLPFGIIEVANRTGAIILPIGVEQVKDTIYINIGRPFDYSIFMLRKCSERENKIAAVAALRDQICTLCWEIWERFPSVPRDSIPDSYWENIVAKTYSEWPIFPKHSKDLQHWKDYISREQALWPYLSTENLNWYTGKNWKLAHSSSKPDAD